MKTCVNCGGRSLKKGSSRETIEVTGRKFVKDVPAMVCASCGRAYVDVSQMQRLELEVAATVANSGMVNGGTFRFMRKALGLTATELAPLLGVAAETLSRWENGGRNTDRAAWVTVGGMVADRLEGRSGTLDRLKSAASGRSPRSKTVHL